METTLAVQREQPERLPVIASQYHPLLALAGLLALVVHHPLAVHPALVVHRPLAVHPALVVHRPLAGLLARAGHNKK